MLHGSHADGLAERVTEAFQQAVMLELEFAQKGVYPRSQYPSPPPRI